LKREAKVMEKKKSLTKEQIIGFDDLKSEVVDVPEWGGSVTIRRMTGGERDAYEADVFETKGGTVTMKRDNFRAKLVARCLVDDNGERMFSDGEIAVLAKKSAAALDKCFAAAQRINGMTAVEQEKIEKNLDIVG
jgi:hypothetical protein